MPSGRRPRDRGREPRRGAGVVSPRKTIKESKGSEAGCQGTVASACGSDEREKTRAGCAQSVPPCLLDPVAARGERWSRRRPAALQLLERNGEDAGWRVRTAELHGARGINRAWQLGQHESRGEGLQPGSLGSGKSPDSLGGAVFGAAWRPPKVILRSISSPGPSATEGGIWYPYWGESEQDGSLT